MDTIVISVEFERNGEQNSLANEVQVVPADISWKDLELMFKLCSDSEEITVLYLDEDNELIHVSSQMELDEAFRVARNNESTLRLKVLCSERLATTTDSAPSTDSADVEPTSASKRYFYLKNGQQELVLDVEGFGQQQGTPVILWEKKLYDVKCPGNILNQLWYEDVETQTLRTAMNDFCIDLNGDRLVIGNYSGLTSQKWKFDGQLIRKLGEFSDSELVHVIGVKPPDTAAVGCSLYAGPRTALNSVVWIREYIDMNNLGQPVPLPALRWLPVCTDEFRKDIVSDLTRAISMMFSTNAPVDLAPQLVQSNIHHACVYCDNCDRNIRGIRYKCGFCPNYDLCSDCEIKQPPVHDPSHVLLKMAVPVSQVQLSRQTLDHVLSRSVGGNVAMKFEAQFIRDETIPDGSVVAPGAKLKKIWMLRNVGSATWTPATTVLRLVSGTVFVTTETPLDCVVPPGNECPVTTELIAPQTPGSFTSHWRLVDKESQRPFGPVVWCQINVDSSLALTSVGGASNGSADVPSAAPAAAANVGNGIDVALSTEDLFMFVKTLEKTTKKSKASGREEQGLLAVPTNTPLAATPPQYTPAAGLSRVSSNDSINNLTEETAVQSTNAIDINMAVMADLVKDKMNELSPNENGNFDNTDAASDRSNDSGFYIVPIPDCFNTELPPSKTSSQSMIVRKDSNLFCNIMSGASGDSDAVGGCASVSNRGDLKSFSSSFASSDFVTTELKQQQQDNDDCNSYSPLLDPSSPAKSSVVIYGDDDVYDVEDVDDDDDDQRQQIHTPVSYPDLLNVGSTLQMTAPAPEPAANVPSWEQIVTDSFCSENFAEHIGSGGGLEETEPLLEEMESSALDSANKPDSDDDDDDDESDDDNNADDKTDEEPAAADSNEEHVEQQRGEDGLASGVSRMPAKQSSLEDMALNLLATTVDATCKAASSAFRTVKDVYNTLQAKNPHYVPPQSDWSPKESTWNPPVSSYSPSQRSTWTPSESTWIPSTYTPPAQDDVWIQPAPSWVPPAADENASEEAAAAARSPVEALIEMGFANRGVNEALLRKYNGDVEKVVQELINGSDQDWPASRH